MGLMAFDNTWYCDKCGERFQDEDDLIYCPKCSNVLKNDWYQMALQSIEKCLDKSVCENCSEEFDGDYNFCPLCSNELKKEGVMKRVEKDNSLIAEWNGEDVCVFDKEIFLSSPHFSVSAIIDCFKWKDYLDSKLESDFMEIDSKIPQRLSFKETFSMFILRHHGEIVRGIIKFIPNYDENDFDGELYKSEIIDVLKIREDLFVILAVDYIIY